MRSIDQISRTIQVVQDSAVKMLRGYVVDIEDGECVVHLGDPEHPLHGVPALSSYTPTVGETVHLARFGSQLLILGSIEDYDYAGTADTPPAKPKPGSVWINPGKDDEVSTWDGSKWVSTRDPTIQFAKDIAEAGQAAAETAQAAADAAAASAVTAQAAADAGAAAALAAQSTADGKNKTYRQTTAPTGGTYVNGDLWFDTDDGNKPYIWTGAAWTDARDATIATAQTTAVAAQTTADGKNKIFVQSATPTATAAGDTWIDTGNGNIVKTWSGSAWVSRQDAAIAAAATAASTAQTTANGKNKVYYQAAAPTGGTYIDGDLWFDSDDGNKPYVRQSAAWVAAQDAAIATAQTAANTAQTTASGKNKVYYQTAAPTGGTYIDGDLWFDTDDGNKVYVRSSAAWVAAQDAAIVTAQSTANTAQVTAFGKNQVFTQATAPNNLLSANSQSIETSSAGWKPNNANVTVARSTAQFYDGAASLALTSAGAGGLSSIYNDDPGIYTIPAIPGQTYTASGWFKAGTTGRVSRLGIVFRSVSASLGTTYSSSSVSDVTTGWTKVSVTAIAGPTAAWIGLVAEVQGTVVGEVHYMDNVWLYREPAIAVGDMWIDTSSGNVLKTWDGSTWTAKTFGAGALAADSVTATQIATGAVGSVELGANAVTAAAIAANAVTSTALGANSVTAAAIAANAVTATAIADAALPTAKVAGLDTSVSTLTTAAATAQATANSKILVYRQAAAPVRNLIPNPSFETDTATWSAQGANTIARSTAWAAIGIASLAMTGNSGGDAYTGTSRSVGTALPVTAGTSYTLSAVARAATASRQVSVGFDWLTAAGGSLSTSYGVASADSTSANTTVSITAVAPPTAALVVAWLRVQSLPNAEVHYFDAILFTPSSVVGTFTVGDLWFDTDDGNKPYAWDGVDWIAQPLGTNAISDLDAAKLSGTLAPARVAAASLNGSVLVADSVTATQIAPLAVGSAELAAAAVIAGKVAAAAITGTELAAGSVIAGKIASGTIVSGDIAANTIAAGNIASGAITTVKLAAGAVTSNEIAANTIAAGNIAAGAITTAKILAGAVTAAVIAGGTITATELAAGSVTTAKIAANAVTANEIAATTITAGNIAAGAITTAKIAANAVTATEILAGAITTTKLAAGAVTTTELAAGAVTAAKITTGTITATQMATGTITAASGVIGSIDASVISTGSLAAARIAAGTITGSHIAAATIDAGKMVAGTITAASGVIGSISASSITSGTLNASLITVTNLAAGSITGGGMTLNATGVFGIQVNNSSSTWSEYIAYDNGTGSPTFATSRGTVYSSRGMESATGAFGATTNSIQDTTRAPLGAWAWASQTYANIFEILSSGGTTKLVAAPTTGGLIINNGAALSETGTTGYVSIPDVPNAPTGVPAAAYRATGTVPMVWSYNTVRLYIYSGAWKYVQFT